MNLNPGRDAIDLGEDAQSSPVRARGYVAPAARYSPPAPYVSEAGSYLFSSTTTAAGPSNSRSDEGLNNDIDGIYR
jgi:hypothetical protein